MGRYTPKYSDDYVASAAPGNSPQSNSPQNWRTDFPKPIVGIGRDGVINEFDGTLPIQSISGFKPIPGSLEAIRQIRMKGYRLVILSNQGWIKQGLLTHSQVDAIHQHLMQLLGQAGCFSIDGLYYAESWLKDDIYPKPGTGMFDRATKELGVNWKQGWYAGDDLVDLKAAQKIGAKPILLKTGQGAETLKKLDTFANRDLLKKTDVFDSLLDFANSLP